MSLALGPVGRKDVPVGTITVPASAFANLLAQLGSRAFGQAEAAAEPSQALPGYLYKEGDLTVDPGDPAQRAARLLVMLGETSLPVTRRRPRWTPTEADEFYDALDLAELDLLETEGIAVEYDD
jgi:hypothetical protein